MPNRLDPQSEYTAKGVYNDEWEAHRFSEINERDLFWLNNTRSDSNHAWRKLDESQAQDTKTSEIRSFRNMVNVYQRY